jgi:biopolymer transport protein ExbD
MALRCRLELTESLNMTPMIDIVFNLLIFFLLSSTYLHEERQLDLELPKVAAAAPLTDAPDEITVHILADGRISVEQQEVSLVGLRVRLQQARARYPDQAVSIRGDADVRYERVAQVISVCKEVGVARLDILVQEE